MLKESKTILFKEIGDFAMIEGSAFDYGYGYEYCVMAWDTAHDSPAVLIKTTCEDLENVFRKIVKKYERIAKKCGIDTNSKEV